MANAIEEISKRFDDYRNLESSPSTLGERVAIMSQLKVSSV